MYWMADALARRTSSPSTAEPSSSPGTRRTTASGRPCARTRVTATCGSSRISTPSTVGRCSIGDPWEGADTRGGSGPQTPGGSGGPVGSHENGRRAPSRWGILVAARSFVPPCGVGVDLITTGPVDIGRCQAVRRLPPPAHREGPVASARREPRRRRRRGPSSPAAGRAGGRRRLPREGPGPPPLPAPRPGRRSRTSTSSKGSRPTRRWVTRSVARPSPARTISSRTRRSVTASRWAVGSSRRRNGAVRRSARARARRCRSPPRAGAPARRSRCRAPPAAGTTPRAGVASRTRATPRRSRPGVARRRFSRRVPVKRCVRWAEKAIASRTVSGASDRTSRPRSRSEPSGTSQKRRSRWTRVDLPEPLAPTTATRCPRRAEGRPRRAPDARPRGRRSSGPGPRGEEPPAPAPSRSVPPRGPGSTTAGGVSSTSKRRRDAALVAPSPCHAAGSAATASNAARVTQGDHREVDTVEPSLAHRRDGEGEHRDHGQVGGQTHERAAEGGGPREAALLGDQRPPACRHPRHVRLLRAEGQDLRQPLHAVGQPGREIGPGLDHAAGRRPGPERAASRRRALRRHRARRGRPPRARSRGAGARLPRRRRSPARTGSARRGARRGSRGFPRPRGRARGGLRSGGSRGGRGPGARGRDRRAPAAA